MGVHARLAAVRPPLRWDSSGIFTAFTLDPLPGAVETESYIVTVMFSSSASDPSSASSAATPATALRLEILTWSAGSATVASTLACS